MDFDLTNSFIIASCGTSGEIQTCLVIFTAQGSRERLVSRHFILIFNYIWVFFYQLHAVSRTQQRKQTVPSVKTLRFPFSAESGGIAWQKSTPRFATTPERRNGNILYIIIYGNGNILYIIIYGNGNIIYFILFN